MFPFLFAVVALGFIAEEPPALGTKALVEVGKDHNLGNGWYALEFDYKIEQGDRFRIEVTPAGRAVVRVRAEVWREHGQGFTPFEGSGEAAGKVQWTMAKPLPGSMARVRIISDSIGKYNVRITKVGMPPVPDARDELIKKLRAEIAELKKQLAAQKQQTEELRKQLENNGPRKLDHQLSYLDSQLEEAPADGGGGGSRRGWRTKESRSTGNGYSGCCG